MKYYTVRITYQNAVIETYETLCPVFTAKHICFETLNGNFHTISRESIKVVEVHAVR